MPPETDGAAVTEAPAGGEAAAGAEEQGEGQAQAQGGSDLGPLMERMDSFTQELSGLREHLQGDGGEEEMDPITALFAGDQGEAGGEGQGLPDFLQPGSEEMAGMQQQFPGVDPQALSQAVNQTVQQAMAPYLQQQQDEARDAKSAALEEEYPELADVKVAEEVVERSVGLVSPMAQQMAQRLGNPDLANVIAEAIGASPEMVEMVYKAGKADLSAAQETPAGADDGGAQLETGAGPAQQSQAGDAEQVFPSGGGSDAERAFWGVT